MTNNIEMLSKNFSRSEMKCKHCGKVDMNPIMLDILQSMRNTFGKAIFITSGYRCPNHPVELKKDNPGEHTYGLAVDIACYGQDTLELLKLAQAHEIKRIGLKQKGDYAKRFMHIGLADRFNLNFPVAIWTY